jgi:hypothetical protein
MHDRTTGADIFEKVDLCLQNLRLDWGNLSCITTDGTPNMIIIVFFRIII